MPEIKNIFLSFILFLTLTFPAVAFTTNYEEEHENNILEESYTEKNHVLEPLENFSLTQFSPGETASRNSEKLVLELSLNQEVYSLGDEILPDLHIVDGSEEKVKYTDKEFKLNHSKWSSPKEFNESFKLTKEKEKISSLLKNVETDEKIGLTLYAEISVNNTTLEKEKEIYLKPFLSVEFITPEPLNLIEKGKEFKPVLDIRDANKNTVETGNFTAHCPNCKEDTKIDLNYENGEWTSSNGFKPEEQSNLSEFYIEEGKDGFGNFLEREVRIIFFSLEPELEKYIEEKLREETSELSITKKSPETTVLESLKEVEIVFETNKEAECYLNFEDSEEYSETTYMDTENNRTHYYTINSDENEKSITAFCEGNGLSADKQLNFKKEDESTADYEISLPSEIGPVHQGDQETRSFSVYNNDLTELSLDVTPYTDCCESWVERDGEPLEEIKVEGGVEKSQEINVKVPLKVEEGTYDIIKRFETSEGVIRERSIPLIVSERPSIQSYNELKNSFSETEEVIKSYRQADMDIESIESSKKEVLSVVTEIETAIEQDEELRLAQKLGELEEQLESLQEEVESKQTHYNFRNNLWMFVIVGVSTYIILFLITMVLLPYYRLKKEQVLLKDRLEKAVESRKKAEKQYFNRKIDRETFMNIMNKRQDQVIHIRSQLDDVEKKLDKGLKKYLTFENFIKAPLKAADQIIKLTEVKDNYKPKN